MKPCGDALALPLLRPALRQRLRLLQPCRIGCRVVARLPDQVVEQLRHLGVEARIRQLLADDGLAQVLDDALGDGVA